MDSIALGRYSVLGWYSMVLAWGGIQWSWRWGVIQFSIPAKLGWDSIFHRIYYFVSYAKVSIGHS